MSNTKLRLAVVCASNQNRSMEAHSLLLKAGIPVSSFGTSSAVKLRGPILEKSNTYPFGTTYEEIYKDLQMKDEALYTNNGLLKMLQRNMQIKKRPEKFQLNQDVFDVIICCEKRCYDIVCVELSSRPSLLNRVVHVINVDIKDRIDDAVAGAQYILEISKRIINCVDLDNEVGEIIKNISTTIPLPVLYNVCFY